VKRKVEVEVEVEVKVKVEVKNFLPVLNLDLSLNLL
jgi:hypothetical protein